MAITPIDGTLPLLSPQVSSIGSAIETNSQSFGDLLGKMIDSTNSAQIEGDKAITDLQAGRADNLHEVMIRMEEADLSMRTLMQLRNKAQSAYKEIMNLSI